MIDCCTPECIDCGDYASVLVCDAMKSIMIAACDYGMKFRFYPRDENQVSRDPYKSIKSITPSTPEGEVPVVASDYLIPALPVSFSPSQRELDKAGVKQPVDLIIYTPSGAWLSQNIDYRDIDIIRWRVENVKTTDGLPSRGYRITEITPNKIIGGVPLYWVFGLVED